MNIIPSFICDKSCSFCNVIMYRNRLIGPLDISFLDQLLSSYGERLTEIIIMGGNPYLLSSEYMNKLVNVCEKYININRIEIFNILSTEPSKIDRYRELFHHVSYDPFDREDQVTTLNKMLALDCEFDINMVVTKNLIDSFGAKKINMLVSTIGKKVVLQTYENSVGNDWSLRPEPKQLAEFVHELKEIDSNLIDFKLLRAPTKNQVDNISRYFDRRVTLRPDKTFHVSFNRKHKISDNIDDLYMRFTSMIHSELTVCRGCIFEDNCYRLYCKNTECYYDRALMEALYGYHTNISM